MRYEAPNHLSGSFTCPHCGTLAGFSQSGRFISTSPTGTRDLDAKLGRSLQCRACQEHVIFFKGEMIYPRVGLAPPAADDMPDEVKKIYDEAAAISSASPRAASALLRLAVEVLVADLVEGAGTLNDNIGTLVGEKRIHEKQQMALDTVRVTGNNAIHGREIADDGAEMCQALFQMVNWLVQTAITEDAQVKGFFAALPESKRDQIRQRDGS